MARINNLTNFVTDIANAIKTKSEITRKITPSEFDTLINGIETGSDVSGVTAVAGDVRSTKKFVNSSGEEVTGTLVTQDSNAEISTSTISLEQIPAEGNIEGLNISEFTNVYQYYNDDATCVQNIKLIAKSLVEKYGYHSYWYAYNFNDGNTGRTNNMLCYTVVMSNSPMTLAGAGTWSSSGIQSNSDLYYRKVIFYQNEIQTDTYGVKEVDLVSGKAVQMNSGWYDFAPTSSGGQVIHTNYEATFSSAAKVFNDLSIVWLETTPSSGIITNYISDSNIIVDSGTVVKKSLTNAQVLSAVPLTADKLRVGETVLGLTGTYTSDANAEASDIAQGKTAYVNGVKVTGTYVAENLDETITDLENQVEELQNALDNKVATSITEVEYEEALDQISDLFGEAEEE